LLPNTEAEVNKLMLTPVATTESLFSIFLVNLL